MVVGQTYNVSGWVQTASPSATVKLTFAKTDSGTTYYAQGAVGPANNSSWSYISGTYTLTASGTITALNFYVESSDLNDIYLDDANIILPPLADPNATGNVNFNVTHQKLEGFGAAVAWYEGWLLAIPEPNRTNLYNTLFRDLGLDIFRIRNTYDYDSGYMSNIRTIVSKALARNPNLKILCSSWSPPTYLKSTGKLDEGTLAGGPSAYVYDDFANWWADSITAWSGTYGVNIDYASIQNEPDWNGNDRCLFNPTENSTYAGYNQAFEAVWQEFNSRWGSSMPKMIGPEAISWDGTKAYINALIDVNHAYGFANHYYGCGDYYTPDSFIAGMTDFGTNYGYKPLFQTEYQKLTGANGNFNYAMDMALIMHNALVYEGLSSYIHWTLFWADDSNSLVSLPSYGSSNYVINPNYYTFKHYAKFTDPNWYRTDANDSEPNYLRITAFKDPCEPNASIVIINTSTDTDINLMLSLTGYTPQNSGIYQTKSDANFAYIGTFSPSTKVLLPKQSITTIHLWGFGNCASVQAWGLGLDSDLNGDCYVNFYDLQILTDNWLHSNCSSSNGWCGWADLTMNGSVDFIDFSDFAPQWKRCNNPLDPNCTQNW